MYLVGHYHTIRYFLVCVMRAYELAPGRIRIFIENFLNERSYNVIFDFYPYETTDSYMVFNYRWNHHWNHFKI